VPFYLQAYFGSGALMLAAAGAWHLFRSGARDPLTLAIAGWTLSCLLFLAVGILTPVDMRYYLASIPAVAIAGAIGASVLWSRRGVPRMIGGLLVAWVLWVGVRTWYNTF
jgi:hypothetical protein